MTIAQCIGVDTTTYGQASNGIGLTTKRMTPQRQSFNEGTQNTTSTNEIAPRDRRNATLSAHHR